MSGFIRLLRHLTMTHWQVRQAFPESSLSAIEAAVTRAEKNHAGQIRVVVEGALAASPLWRGLPARQRALDVFSFLRVWDTEHNNGVLIYLLLADRDVEIVADRGIAKRVSQETWEDICRQMEMAFGTGRFEEGVIAGVDAVARTLATHFPPQSGGANELTDRPLLM
jgi:uncharacterized membrane protein